ncbi:MAG TPA: toprim domain-containing protein [Stellaceae bacterium]|nr:toprim domain-containing protein [Stellaceae bacterium]
MSPPLLPITDIVAGLAARIDTLAGELLPRGIREGHEWRVGSLAGEPGRSMAVHLRGNKAGVWADFSSGESGDALDLVAAILFAGDKKRAVRWALSWLGFDGKDPARLQQTRQAQQHKIAEPQHDTKAAAWRIWLASSPVLRDTVAERYLASREISLERLGRQPRALRFHPQLRHPSGRAFPAMVAAIVAPDGELTAVHRTFLLPDGSGKIPGDAKLTLGRYAGGLIPLWRGASGKPLRQAPAGERIIVSEGIEDGLTLAMAVPELRVVAAVSLSNMGSLVLPPAIKTVLIAAQNDPWWDNKAQTAHGAARGFDRAVRHFQSEGRIVRDARPSGYKDHNDLLRGRRTAHHETSFQ